MSSATLGHGPLASLEGEGQEGAWHIPKGRGIFPRGVAHSIGAPLGGVAALGAQAAG